MKNILLIALLSLLSWNGWAHNPLTAKVELNTKDSEISVVNIYLSQTGLHQALLKYFDKTDISALSTTAYKKLAAQYIKEHIQLVADGTPLVIGEGGIKLGSHQTDLKFLIKNFPKNIHQLQANIDIGKENGNHHTIFLWQQKEGQSKVVLSERNQFQTQLEVGEIIVEDTTQLNKQWMGLGLLLVTIVSGFLVKFYVSRKSMVEEGVLQVTTTS